MSDLLVGMFLGACAALALNELAWTLATWKVARTPGTRLERMRALLEDE